MRCNSCNYKKACNNMAPAYDNFMPAYDNAETYSNMRSDMNCNMPVRRYLEPVLVARIYNQPIVEELQCSAMSLTIDNTTTVSNMYSDVKPICNDSNCNYDNNDCECKS